MRCAGVWFVLASAAPVAWAQPAATPAAKPGAVQVYKDWVVGCDNALSCTAVTLFPAGEDGVEGGHELVITRGGGAGDTPQLRFILDDAAVKGLVQIVLDDKLLRTSQAGAGEVVVTGANTVELVLALAQGSSLEIRKGERVLAQPPLSGAAAALRYMDAQQDRAGGVTAAVARGPKPATAIKAAPAVPVIKSVAVDPRIGEPLQPAELARAIQLSAASECSLEADEVEQGVELQPLDADRTLVLLPCDRGAYNFSSTVLIARGKPGSRKLTAVQFDDKDADTPAGAARVLVNVTWNSKTGLLEAFSKGRGIGDCGSSSTHAWDGSSMRLVHADLMPECRGSTQSITTWRARVL